MTPKDTSKADKLIRILKEEQTKINFKTGIDQRDNRTQELEMILEVILEVIILEVMKNVLFNRTKLELSDIPDIDPFFDNMARIND